VRRNTHGVDPAAPGGEQRAIGRRREPADVLGQGLADHLGERDRSPRGRSLGAAARALARRDLPLDSSGPPKEVDIVDAQRQQFANPQTQTGLREDHRLASWRHSLRHLPDLLDRQWHKPLAAGRRQL
jgi:hypothetical protein